MFSNLLSLNMEKNELWNDHAVRTGARARARVCVCVCVSARACMSPFQLSDQVAYFYKITV
jgi:hypothetical protein